MTSPLSHRKVLEPSNATFPRPSDWLVSPQVQGLWGAVLSFTGYIPVLWSPT